MTKEDKLFFHSGIKIQIINHLPFSFVKPKSFLSIDGDGNSFSFIGSLDSLDIGPFSDRLDVDEFSFALALRLAANDNAILL